MENFRQDYGEILARLWRTFGQIENFGQFFENFWPVFKKFWPVLGELLASSWRTFGQILENFWPVF